jgi:histidine triad (HIT) family protein
LRLSSIGSANQRRARVTGSTPLAVSPLLLAGLELVAISDIAPKAPVHLLVLPARHVDTFRDVGDFPDGEAARMLRFVADVARLSGLEDYRVVVNIGPGGGQTVFHLHWHVLGGGGSLPGFE